ncbi:hypothetical protein POSPLADRAFT_1146473 [Postia placenta MAD-698-R-SB12]|uniref:FAD-binding PCMH-type domain-containing protein n=1 Tax=Postia placenta MAD-698-R-SB12 TaxID=670580 RepID=A0A1X6MWV4_9APHY|nr:hypothetical protein POSPLADRAFT_1146473 [Postia placenta MAD-698-R-SB12]OSX60855.1 hypothetical protein POSPLADRAFT_1146473 [Postia placenta MAD-698-R-SB12]
MYLATLCVLALLRAGTYQQIANAISSASSVYYPRMCFSPAQASHDGDSRLIASLSYKSDIYHYATSSTENATCSVEPGTAENVGIILQILGANQAPFAVKGGGHAMNPGYSSTTGVQISMTRFHSVVNDASTSTAAIGAGLTWDKVYSALEQYDVNSSNPDLFFGLKGGYNNFGIVTTFTFQTYPQGQVWGGQITYPSSSVNNVSAATATFSSNVTDPKAAIITTYDYTGGLTLASVIIFYDAPSGIFDDFLSIPALATNVKTRSFLSLVQVEPTQETANFRGYKNTVPLTEITQGILNDVLTEAQVAIKQIVGGAPISPTFITTQGRILPGRPDVVVGPRVVREAWKLSTISKGVLRLMRVPWISPFWKLLEALEAACMAVGRRGGGAWRAVNGSRRAPSFTRMRKAYVILASNNVTTDSSVGILQRWAAADSDAEIGDQVMTAPPMFGSVPISKLSFGAVEYHTYASHFPPVLNSGQETMQSDLQAKTGYIPRHGSYIALWLDPVRMAESLDDPRLTAVASKLTPRKYIAFVDSVYDFPLRRHPWHRCFIRFVGVGMPKDEPEEFKTSMSFEERVRHEQYLSEDWAQHQALRAQQNPPPPPVEPEETPTFSEIVANPDSSVPPNDAVNVRDWLQAVDCSEDQDGAPCPHEDAVSEHFDAAITAEDDRIPTLNSDTDTEYPDSVDSDSDAEFLVLTADNNTDTEAIVEAVLGPFRAKVDDIDVVPLVSYSFDLAEGGECADPRGFIEEAEAMAELIRKARDGTLGDPRAATPDSLVPLAQDVAEGTTPEPDLVRDEAPTNADSGNAITEHPSDTMETAIERSVDTPPESSPETKGDTTLPEARSFWRLVRMKGSPLSSTKAFVAGFFSKAPTAAYGLDAPRTRDLLAIWIYKCGNMLPAWNTGTMRPLSWLETSRRYYAPSSSALVRIRWKMPADTGTVASDGTAELILNHSRIARPSRDTSDQKESACSESRQIVSGIV